MLARFLGVFGRINEHITEKNSRKQPVSFQEFETIANEVEPILNSTHCYVFSDFRKTEPVTFEHFLIGRRLLCLYLRQFNSYLFNEYEIMKMRKYQDILKIQV